MLHAQKSWHSFIIRIVDVFMVLLNESELVD